MHARPTPSASSSAFREKSRWTSSRQNSQPGRRRTTTTVGLAAQSEPACTVAAESSLAAICRSGMPIRLESGVEMAAMRPRAAAGGEAQHAIAERSPDQLPTLREL